MSLSRIYSYTLLLWKNSKNVSMMLVNNYNILYFDDIISFIYNEENIKR